MHPFRTIYIDMNSFFASVEQHEEPALRGKPVGITAMEGNVGCLVAASYEAKYFGVKTTMNIQEAKTLCPKIILRPSRHRLYVHYNQRIAKIFDRYAELEYIRSIDEFQIALGGQSTHLEVASKLVQAMKSAINNEIGKSLQFSAGIGSNHLLAKIAGKLEKPNGMQWLSPDNMPNRLAEISGLVFLGLAFLTFGVLFSYSSLDPSFNNITDQEAQNILGFTGAKIADLLIQILGSCLLYTSPSPRDRTRSRMPSSA